MVLAPCRREKTGCKQALFLSVTLSLRHNLTVSRRLTHHMIGLAVMDARQVPYPQ
jgi:hypothetical protein